MSEPATTDSVVLDQWSDEHAKLGSVVKALTELRHRSARSATRTAVMTLVVVATTDAEAALATQAMHALRGHHPARIVLVQPNPSADGGLQATASLYAGSADQQPVVFEEVDLRVGGEATAHLDTVVEPFTLADLPIVVWYPGKLPPPSDPLLGVATAVLIDTKEAGTELMLAELRELARRRTVVDLSWARLRPWRELLAGLFEPPSCRAFLADVRSAEVSGKPGPRTLLGGWLSAQLGLSVEQVTLHDARHVRLTVHASHGDRVGVFEVGRFEDRRAVWAEATVIGAVSHRQVLPLPEDGLAWSLGQALTHLASDRVWERAVAAAAAMAPDDDD